MHAQYGMYSRLRGADCEGQVLTEEGEDFLRSLTL